MNGNRTFLKREDPNKWNFFSQPTLYISKGDDINWTSSMTKQAFEGMLMLQLNALIHLHFCDSLTRCWCFWTSWSGNTYFIKVLFDKKYNTSWMNILFHGKLYQMKYHKIQTKWNWRHAYLVLMLLNSRHFAKWAASKSRHQYENGRNKYVVYFDQDFSNHMLCYFP